MRILHIVPTYRPAYKRGGPIWSVHNLNKWLVKKGVDVTVYTTDIDISEKVPLNTEVLIDGVRVYYFRHSFPRLWEYWRVGFLPAFLPRHWEYSSSLHRALAKNAHRFDLFHITSTFLFASILGAYYANKFKKPYIISPRGNLMEPLELKGVFRKRLYIWLLEKNALRNAIIHCTVPAERDHYIHHKLPFRDSLIIPNSIEEEEFLDPPEDNYFRKIFDIDSKKKIILFLGRINWKKGLDTLIPAMAKIASKEPGALLVIAGGDEGGYKDEVESLISDYKLQDKVIFVDMLIGGVKLGALKDSDVFVLSSYSENFGMSVLEAMYFGLPVVVTSSVGLAPYVKEAGAGIVVEKNIDKIAEAILKILRDPALGLEMGKRGRELVRARFSGERVAIQFVEAYNKLINQ